MRIPSIRSRTCPRCGNHTFRRSHLRSFIERGVSKLLVPCRCYGCDYRYYRPSWAAGSPVNAPASKVNQVAQ